MARSDLLLNLARAALASDRVGIERSVASIAADERAKKHGILAEQLSSILSRNGSSARPVPAVEGSRGRDFASEVSARRELQSLVLPKVAAEACAQLVEEQMRVELLHSFGLEPRHRVLLVGPPGNGKTALAEALAHELSLPLLVVRYDLLIGSYLGETAGRLRKLVEHVRTTPCVLFFDEFDAIGKERGDKHETGEIKRVVSSLLMHVDELPSYVVVVAATNHEELLDRAVWRRFQMKIELPPPTPAEARRFIGRFFALRGQDIVGSSESKRLSVRMPPVRSYAELEEYCLAVLRRMVLGQQSIAKAVEAELSLLKKQKIGAWDEGTATSGDSPGS